MCYPDSKAHRTVTLARRAIGSQKTSAGKFQIFNPEGGSQKCCQIGSSEFALACNSPPSTKNLDIQRQAQRKTSYGKKGLQTAGSYVALRSSPKEDA